MRGLAGTRTLSWMGRVAWEAGGAYANILAAASVHVADDAWAYRRGASRAPRLATLCPERPSARRVGNLDLLARACRAGWPTLDATPFHSAGPAAAPR